MKAALKIREYRKNPILYVQEQFGVTPDEWQKEALIAFVNGDLRVLRLSLQACAGPGKTAVLAWIGWLFLSCYGDKGQHPKGAVVAVTSDNLKDNLWAEFSKWQGRSKFLSHAFKWTAERIYAVDHKDTWFLSARTWSKKANPDEQGRVLSGIHSEFVLFLIDESGDIPVAVLKAAEQAMSAERFARIVQAGNPTSHDGMLYAAQSVLADKWKVIRITGDPDDPKRSPRIDLEWAKEQVKTFGREDPWVMAYILGQFPKASINTILTVEEVDEAMGRSPFVEDYEFSQKRLGVDVARFGLDSTVIFPRQGLMSWQPIEMRGATNPEIAARVADKKNEWGSNLEFVDGTGGYGSGVVDALRQAGFAPNEIHFNGKATKAEYYNKRSEMWMEIRDWVRRGGALPLDNQLKKELTTPTYTFQNGKYRVEGKDQIKKRLGFSPDKADALGLTFAFPEQPGSYGNGLSSYNDGPKVSADYDPLED